MTLHIARALAPHLFPPEPWPLSPGVTVHDTDRFLAGLRLRLRNPVHRRAARADLARALRALRAHERQPRPLPAP